MFLWQRPDLLQPLSSKIDLAAIEALRKLAAEDVRLSQFKDTASLISMLPAVDQLQGPLGARVDADFANDVVTIGHRDNLSEAQFEQIGQAISALCPWRKGPFKLFGHAIDAEWRSNLKWERIVEALGELRGRKIVDVGCGNGYYMFRAAAHQPKFVLGIDPSYLFYLSFEMFQRYAQASNLQYERLGAQHMDLFDQAFDVGLCMGVVYHRKSPIDVLEKLKHSIRVGGHAIIESQTVPGAGTTALFPADRYAKARNVFFLPTKDCLVNWVKRAGFRDVEVVAHSPVTTEEQRKTDLMTLESLSDFLDPDDLTKTIEGYPAPYRTAVRGVRKFL